MEGVLETQRRAHEEVDRLELAVVTELLEPAPTHRGRLMQEQTAAAMLEQLMRTAQHLRSLYQDLDNDRQREVEAITIAGAAGGEFGNFYARLKDVKDAHRRFPTDRPIDDSEFQALLSSCRPSEENFDALFSGEEAFGKYLDLTLLFEQYVNLKNVRRLDYLQYLEEFDNFDAVPMATKLSHAYARYLQEIESYFERFFRLAKPLFNLEAAKNAVAKEFEGAWSEGRVAGWEEAAHRDKDNGASGIFCGPCDKLFTNKSVYEAHLAGKKHLKAAESFDPSKSVAKSAPSTTDSHNSHNNNNNKSSNARSLALKEARIARYAEILGQVRSDTRTNVERKQSRTLEEREEDMAAEAEEEPVPEDAFADDSQDGAIYNPKNLPLDWDGKPIPYWLWKLHGLGIRYPCEICGNHTYMGRKAFDQHFFEWRHSNGMKALGIPNTKHFFQITRIEEAQTLWDKLKQQSRTENFRPEAMEEFEDHLGNVYNRKTYEDLRRQGLI